MKWLTSMVLLGPLTLCAAPLRVASVLRFGMPPYEDQPRVYRLEGEGCAYLRAGEVLVLRRDGERRSIGRLKVSEVRSEYALSLLQESGETYPLKGDLVIRATQCGALPELPPTVPGKHLQTFTNLQPKALALAAPSIAKVQETRSISLSTSTLRQSIYFLKGDASLSPGALAKLKASLESWGIEGQWVLACPSDPSASPVLLQGRIAALRIELQRLGIKQLNVQPLPAEAPSRYDVIYVIHESR